MKNRIFIVLGFCVLLCACDATNAVWWSARDLTDRIFRSPDVNLVEKSTAAADYLVPQIKTYIKRENTISTAPLTLVRESAVTSEFGRRVPVQVAERLRQLGYTVILPDDNGASSVGQFVVGGTYDKDSRDVFVNLRVTDMSTGQVIASFDYNMPVTSEIKDLAAPEARIYRIQE